MSQAQGLCRLDPHLLGMSLPPPHAAAGMRETQERSSMMVAQQLIDVPEGRSPINRVA